MLFQDIRVGQYFFFKRIKMIKLSENGALTIGESDFAHGLEFHLEPNSPVSLG